jgi:hypothetical protein
MAKFDELKGNLGALYEEAQRELRDLEVKRADVLKTLELLGPLFGSKTVAAPAKEVVDEAKPAKRRGRKTGKVAKAADKADKADKAGSDEKKSRIKSEDLFRLVMDYLKKEYPKSLAGAEILAKLFEAGMPQTASFRTRVYGSLGKWAKEDVIDHPERGVYRYPKKDADLNEV